LQRCLIPSKSRRRMKRLQLSLILLTFLIPVKAQEFCGMTEKSIRAVMERDFKGLTPDDNVRNDVYRYLKYHSVDDNETWLIFLDERNRCKGVRITYSNSLYDTKISELNRKYGHDDGGKWSYRLERNRIAVTVHRDEWFFTVTHVRM